MTHPAFTAADLTAAIAAVLVAVLNLLALFGWIPLDPALRTVLVSAASAAIALLITILVGRQPAAAAVRRLVDGPTRHSRA